jgi:hypothetical protein
VLVFRRGRQGGRVSAAADDRCLGPIVRSLPDARAIADELTAGQVRLNLGDLVALLIGGEGISDGWGYRRFRLLFGGFNGSSQRTVMAVKTGA